MENKGCESFTKIETIYTSITNMYGTIYTCLSKKEMKRKVFLINTIRGTIHLFTHTKKNHVSNKKTLSKYYF